MDIIATLNDVSTIIISKIKNEGWEKERSLLQGPWQMQTFGLRVCAYGRVGMAGWDLGEGKVRAERRKRLLCESGMGGA